MTKAVIIPLFGSCNVAPRSRTFSHGTQPAPSPVTRWFHRSGTETAHCALID